METRDSQAVANDFEMSPRELLLFEAELGTWLKQPGSDEKLLKQLFQLPDERLHWYWTKIRRHMTRNDTVLVAEQCATPVYVPPGAEGL